MDALETGGLLISRRRTKAEPRRGRIEAPGASREAGGVSPAAQRPRLRRDRIHVRSLPLAPHWRAREAWDEARCGRRGAGGPGTGASTEGSPASRTTSRSSKQRLAEIERLTPIRFRMGASARWTADRTAHGRRTTSSFRSSPGSRLARD